MNTRERAARSLCSKRCMPISLTCPGDGGAKCVEWALYTPDVDAVLDAIRTPSPKLLREIAGAMSPGKRPTQARVSERAKHGIRWRAGIDYIKRGEG